MWNIHTLPRLDGIAVPKSGAYCEIITHGHRIRCGTQFGKRAYATTYNRTPSCSCKQAMILKRFAAVGFPLGPNI